MKSTAPSTKQIRLLTAVQIDQIVAMFADGTAVQALADEFRVHRNTIVGRYLRLRRRASGLVAYSGSLQSLMQLWGELLQVALHRRCGAGLRIWLVRSYAVGCGLRIHGGIGLSHAVKLLDG